MEGVAHELQLLEQLRPELVGALAGVPGHMRWGCSLGRTGLQPGAHGVAAWGARGCSLGRTGLQPRMGLCKSPRSNQAHLRGSSLER